MKTRCELDTGNHRGEDSDRSPPKEGKSCVSSRVLAAFWGAGTSSLERVAQGRCEKKKIELKFSLSCRPTTRHGDSGPGHVALHQRPPKIPLRRQALVPVIGLALIFFRIRAACPFLTHRHHDLIRRSRRPSSVLGKIHAPIRTPLRGHKPGRIPHEVIYVPTASAQRPPLLAALHGPLVNPRRALSHQLAAPANPCPHAWDLRSARFGSPLSVHDRYLYLNIVLRAWERKPRSRSTRESSVLVEHTGMTTTLRRASARLRTFTATRPFCYACAIRFKRRLITPRPSVVARRHGRRVNVDTLRGNAGDSPVRRSVRIHLRRTRTTLRRGRVRGARWIRADAGE